MENESTEQIQEVEEESQDAQELDEISVQLDDTSYEAISLSENNSGIARTKYYKQTYRPAWEQMPDFKGWLRGVVGEPTRAYCTYCQKTLHAHRLSLLKHTCTIRHQKAAQIHNSRKNKQNSQMEPQEIQTVVLHADVQQSSEGENEEGETLEYADMTSEAEEDERMQKENDDLDEEEEEEEFSSMEMSQVPFQKHNQNFQMGHIKAPISTHVLDTARGCPVSGLQVSLYKLIDGRWTYINEGVTSVSGKFAGFIDRGDFTPGRYKLHFDVDRYFDAHKQDTLYPFIEVVFDCRVVADNYHIPLQLSPFGYSTFRGC